MKIILMMMMLMTIVIMMLMLMTIVIMMRMNVSLKYASDTNVAIITYVQFYVCPNVTDFCWLDIC